MSSVSTVPRLQTKQKPPYMIVITMMIVVMTVVVAVIIVIIMITINCLYVVPRVREASRSVALTDSFVGRAISALQAALQATFYPFGQFCEADVSLPNVNGKEQPPTYFLWEGVGYGKGAEVSRRARVVRFSGARSAAQLRCQVARSWL